MVQVCFWGTQRHFWHWPPHHLLADIGIGTDTSQKTAFSWSRSLLPPLGGQALFEIAEKILDQDEITGKGFKSFFG